MRRTHAVESPTQSLPAHDVDSAAAAPIGRSRCDQIQAETSDHPRSLLLYLRVILANLLPAHVQNLRFSVETVHYDGQTLRHFNSSMFWQKQHDGLHDMLEKEQAANFVLKQENEALQTQITQLSARSKPGRKRKLAEQEEPETVKRMKAGTIAISEFGSAVDVDPGVTFLHDG